MTKTWVDKARRARDLLAEPVEHGQKLAARDRIARSLSLSRGTLDNYLAALDALERFGEIDPDLAAMVSRHSAAAVAALGRWVAYDLDGVRAFLRSEPKASLRRTLAAEKAARLAHGRVPPSPFSVFVHSLARHMPDDYHLLDRGSGPPIASAFARVGLWPHPPVFGIDWEGPVEPYAAYFGVSFVGRLHPELDPHGRHRPDPVPARQSERGFIIAGVIEVSHHELDEMYRRLARSVFAQAVAATTLYPLVIVFFPDAGARQAMAGNFPELPARLLPDAPVRSGQVPAEGKGRMGEAIGSPWIRPAGPHGACILLTTPDSFFEDWSGVDKK